MSRQYANDNNTAQGVSVNACCGSCTRSCWRLIGVAKKLQQQQQQHQHQQHPESRPLKHRYWRCLSKNKAKALVGILRKQCSDHAASVHILQNPHQGTLRPSTKLIPTPIHALAPHSNSTSACACFFLPSCVKQLHVQESNTSRHARVILFSVH